MNTKKRKQGRKTNSLYNITSDFQAVLTLLEQGEIDEQTAQDTLESIEMDLEDKADNIAYVLQSLDDDIARIDTEVKRLNERKKAIKKNQDILKESLKGALMVANKKSFKTALHSFTVKTSGSRSVVVDDADKVPQEFKQIVEEVKIDKNTLKEWMKNCKVESCDFAHLEEAKVTLTIK